MLQDFLEANPHLTVNKAALRLNVARPFLGNRVATWADIANLIVVEDITKRSVNAAGILRTAAWKTSVMPERKRVVQSHFVNGLDIYAVVKQYDAGAMKPLLNADDLDAADAFDRRRAHATDCDSDSEATESGSASATGSEDEEGGPPAKRSKLDKGKLTVRIGGSAAELADA